MHNVARLGTVALAAAVLVGAAAPPADARVDRRAAEPRSGGPATTFTYRYMSGGSDGSGGDQLYLYGPRRTRCRGLIVQLPTGYEAGRQTVRFTHDAGREGRRRFEFAPFREDSQVPLRTWCPGYYRGQIRFEGDSHDFLLHRFWFVVR